ncbi:MULTISPECIES: hypothetical protein [unclassified Ensifer]|uniref:hypothetical protein n=1 Tax=unclassified Ensifer TaxID=2633371 RepID=UPI0008131D1C|nr:MULTISPECIES: hypothetical protein [unclassified Ensifer]OCP00660.1 hypothetical protein BC362_03290 [Ensifer sp. LC14]OCP07790.1 hypothetical protein BBX50_20760 [Ensifer sp. LC11]OCP08554.1 hypothetical protein BC374_20975 [Ensifer sp. LC13]OCP32154.1 hypothetical protein BC364_20715 [Ensifer sp. LC499]
MILIAGIPHEPPVALAIAAAEESGAAYIVFDQRDHLSARLQLKLDAVAGWQGTLSTAAEVIDLQAIDGVYVRLMDERYLPDVAVLPPSTPERLRAARFHSLLYDWLNTASIRIASRPRAMLSNMSKTYQAGIIHRCGFGIPETLVTNDPDAVVDFVDRCAAEGDDVVYKSVSGTRSIVETFRVADRTRLSRIRWCPTQFQRKVRGTDVRVHVVGSRVFATRIESEATDYRYSGRQSGTDAKLTSIELEPRLQKACVALSAALDLPFTGIDLRLTPEGEAVCFEANPCPAYSYYQSRTGAPIAAALIRWLAEGER